MPISVAIVEDSRQLREQLAALVAGASGFRCVGTYESGEEALRGLPQQPADVVLMDINLPRMSGVECTEQLQSLVPNALVVMLTVYDDAELIFSALEMGASGYLLKRTPPAAILKAIREVHAGGAPMSCSIARQVVRSFTRPASPAASDLAPRETEVLALVAQGYLNKEIADRLGLTLETVNTYLKAIYRKLHVRSRTAAAMKVFGPKRGGG
ncbi:MAG: response regulator transcription factor [Verrucomicrobia bacterium]|nr:response regulator transcription factor [Verrucomicrobiota bacterium]